MKGRIKFLLELGLIGAILLFSSCSINKMATSMVADALTSPGGTNVFASEEDPELVKDALPFALKMYESLLQSDPENRGLLIATAEGFVSYANAFIHTPASMLGYDELDRQKEMLARAKGMYLRGRNYALQALELEYPGFRQAILRGEGAEYLGEMDAEDVKALYWAAAGWMGAVSAAGFDAGMLMELPRPVALTARALELDENFSQGALHSILIDIYGAVPAEQMLYGSSELGQDAQQRLQDFYRAAGLELETTEEKARFHFKRAVEISDGKLAGPYVSLAGSVVMKNQDAEEYRGLLNTALAIDTEETPSSRLVNTITQQKARWMLDHIEDNFLILD